MDLTQPLQAYKLINLFSGFILFTETFILTHKPLTPKTKHLECDQNGSIESGPMDLG
jgi:hypothetical protein